MAITEAEKKVLLERLEKARIAKQAKKAERDAAKEKEKPVAPPPAPPAAEPVAAIPTPEPVVEKPAETIPPVPDLVKAAAKKPAKKVKIESEDDSEEEEIKLPPKKKQAVKKELPFMKLKIYKEPTNAAAFQQMLEALSCPAEYEEERPAPSAPIDIPVQKPPRQLVKQSNNVVKPMNEARAMALSFFG